MSGIATVTTPNGIESNVVTSSTSVLNGLSSSIVSSRLSSAEDVISNSLLMSLRQNGNPSTSSNLHSGINGSINSHNGVDFLQLGSGNIPTGGLNNSGIGMGNNVGGSTCSSTASSTLSSLSSAMSASIAAATGCGLDSATSSTSSLSPSSAAAAASNLRYGPPPTMPPASMALIQPNMYTNLASHHMDPYRLFL